MATSGRTYTTDQFGRLIAANTSLTQANGKWVKKNIIETSRLLPDAGSKWSAGRVAGYLFEQSFIKPEDINWSAAGK
jgi:hypothetical protein